MPEYGDVFEYWRSMMGFEYLDLALFAVYGLFIVWIAAAPKVDTTKGL